MQFRLWSDVHLEFGPLIMGAETPEDKEVTLFVAGDLDVGCRPNAQELMVKCSNRFKHVFYTPGNHEYYHENVDNVNKMWADFANDLPNFYFLQGDCVRVDGLRVIGGTFWTDFNRADERIMEDCGYRMNDYRTIRINCAEGERRFTPEDAWRINKDQRGRFARFLDEQFEGKTVVMTHHAPTEHSIDPQYNHHSSDRKLNFAYRNTGLENWFEEKNFDAWLHGHIHRRQEHVVHGKRIIANPRGYDGYEAMADTFEEDKVFVL